jgi:hypothetical protein
VAGGIVEQAKDVGERVVEVGGRAVDAVTDVLPGTGGSSSSS